MVRTLTAKLVYGYDLGGVEDEWKVREANEYGGLALDWLGEDTDDVIDAMEERLLAVAAGFTEPLPAEGRGDYYARRRAAKSSLRVGISWYGVSGYNGYLLAAHTIHVWGAEVVDLAALEAHPARPKWDAALAAAVEALGVTPTQEKPGWLLCADYG